MKIYNVIKASEYDGEYIGSDILGSFTEKDAAIQCAQNELEVEMEECHLCQDDIYHTESSDNDYLFQMWQVSMNGYKFTISIVYTEVEETKTYRFDVTYTAGVVVEVKACNLKQAKELARKKAGQNLSLTHGNETTTDVWVVDVIKREDGLD